MAIIKAAAASRLMKNAVVLDLGDLKQQADAIVADAQQRADHLLQQANAEADELVATADQRGYEQGFARGNAEGQEAGREQGRVDAIAELRPQIEALLHSLDQTVSQWNSDRQAMLSQARTDVLKFAFALAEKVINRAIEFDPSIIEDQMAEALAMIAQPSAAKIIVHPDDMQRAREYLPTLLEMTGTGGHVEVVSDPEVGRGGCRITTAGGSIDSTVDRQLQRLTEALLPAGRDLCSTTSKHAGDQSQQSQANVPGREIGHDDDDRDETSPTSEGGQ